MVQDVSFLVPEIAGTTPPVIQLRAFATPDVEWTTLDPPAPRKVSLTEPKIKEFSSIFANLNLLFLFSPLLLHLQTKNKHLHSKSLG